VLDRLLVDHLEKGMGEAELCAAGHDPETVRRVLAMVERAEFKRRQSPPALPL
jgi:NAD+ synthase (glutamine-hydrolysing)